MFYIFIDLLQKIVFYTYITNARKFPDLCNIILLLNVNGNTPKHTLIRAFQTKQ